MLSLDLLAQLEKNWIGINQNAANRYVEHFLRNGSFPDMVGEGEQEVLQEQKTLT